MFPTCMYDVPVMCPVDNDIVIDVFLLTSEARKSAYSFNFIMQLERIVFGRNLDAEFHTPSQSRQSTIILNL